MRALFVLKALDFERGLDPLEKMKIGRVHNIKELIEMYTKLQKAYSLPTKSYSLDTKKLINKFIKELIENIPLRFSLKQENYSDTVHYLYSIFDQLNREEYYTIDKIITTYYNKIPL